MELARASVLGQPVHQISPLVASTLLLVGMIDRDLGDFQKATVKWAVLLSLLMMIASLLTGAITSGLLLSTDTRSAVSANETKSRGLSCNTREPLLRSLRKSKHHAYGLTL